MSNGVYLNPFPDGCSLANVTTPMDVTEMRAMGPGTTTTRVANLAFPTIRKSIKFVLRAVHSDYINGDILLFLLESMPGNSDHEKYIKINRKLQKQNNNRPIIRPHTFRKRKAAAMAARRIAIQAEVNARRVHEANERHAASARQLEARRAADAAAAQAAAHRAAVAAHAGSAGYQPVGDQTIRRVYEGEGGSLYKQEHFAAPNYGGHAITFRPVRAAHPSPIGRDRGIEFYRQYFLDDRDSGAMAAAPGPGTFNGGEGRENVTGNIGYGHGDHGANTHAANDSGMQNGYDTNRQSQSSMPHQPVPNMQGGHYGTGHHYAGPAHAAHAYIPSTPANNIAAEEDTDEELSEDDESVDDGIKSFDPSDCGESDSEDEDTQSPPYAAAGAQAGNQPQAVHLQHALQSDLTGYQQV